MAEMLKQITTYKVESESAATELIETSKRELPGVVTYKTTYKEKKVKGEVIDSWYVVEITERHDL